MPHGDRTSDGLYHQLRAEQERHLASRARTPKVRDCHVELMRLHELRRDGLSRFD